MMFLLQGDTIPCQPNLHLILNVLGILKIGAILHRVYCWDLLHCGLLYIWAAALLVPCVLPC